MVKTREMSNRFQKWACPECWTCNNEEQS